MYRARLIINYLSHFYEVQIYLFTSSLTPADLHDWWLVPSEPLLHVLAWTLDFFLVWAAGVFGLFLVLIIAAGGGLRCA